VLAGVAHWAMTWVHPFADGNGRMARLLTSIILLEF
jgi:Fic family protein